MAGFTNKGKYRILELVRGGTLPTNFYIALYTSAVAPTADTNTHGDLTQIGAGNGYTTGGFQLTPNATDFDVLTEDDGNDRALIQVKDVSWTASGGAIPASGNDARYAGMTDDNVTESSREIWWYWDLGADYSVSDTQTLTLQDLEARIN